METKTPERINKLTKGMLFYARGENGEYLVSDDFGTTWYLYNPEVKGED